MTDNQKDKLFPYFAYLYSQQLNPDKYGKAGSIDEWAKAIQSSPDDLQQITSAAAELSDEDWNTLAKQYQSETPADQNKDMITSAKKGTKLQKLKEFQKAHTQPIHKEPIGQEDKIEQSRLGMKLKNVAVHSKSSKDSKEAKERSSKDSKEVEKVITKKNRVEKAKLHRKTK